MRLFDAATALLIFEAVIRLPGGGTTHVTTQAKDYYRARDLIEKTYCGAPTHASSCIVEGPWPSR